MPVETTRLTIGSGSQAEIVIDDPGLSEIHASINLDANQIWILDEGSEGGTYVNGKKITPTGCLLRDGDEVTLGFETSITARITDGLVDKSSNRTRSRTPLVAGLLSLSVLLLVALAVLRFPAEKAARVATSSTTRPALTESPTETAPQIEQPKPLSLPDEAPAAEAKLYARMTDEERMAFVERQAMRITAMISNDHNPELFDSEVIARIKTEVDAYARARGSSGLWGVQLRFLFERAAPYAPHIIKSFNQENVPPVVGLYIVWIESSYVNIASENHARAMGLFQFIPGTAIQYKLMPSDRTNFEKMAPAAARYMKDRITDFGGDAKGVALAIANYNRGGTHQDLRKIIDAENPDRSFWTLLANKERLDQYFKSENSAYVPRFFAAAIIGENPGIFGVERPPLSLAN